jgi:hypothetical protein
MDRDRPSSSLSSSQSVSSQSYREHINSTYNVMRPQAKTLLKKKAETWGEELISIQGLLLVSP